MLNTALSILLASSLSVLFACFQAENEIHYNANCWELDFDSFSTSLAGTCTANGTLQMNDGYWVIRRDGAGLHSLLYITSFEYAYGGKLNPLEGKVVELRGRYEYEVDFNWLAISEIKTISVVEQRVETEKP